MQSDYFLSFYADTPQETNRKFYFKVYSRSTGIDRVKHFEAKGYKIRAAWLRNNVSGVNERIA